MVGGQSPGLTLNTAPGPPPLFLSSLWHGACLGSGSLGTCCRPPGPGPEAGSWPGRWGTSLKHENRAASFSGLMAARPPRPRLRPPLTAFCRHGSEPAEDKRLPVEAGHVLL